MPQDTCNELIAPEKEGRKPSDSLYEMAEVLASAVLCIVILFTFVVRFAGVVGSSMFPTLKNGEWLAVSAYVKEPARGDIVIISPSTGVHEPLVKRVIALPGDEVDIANGRVFINGEAIEEAYLQPDVETYPGSEMQSSVEYPVQIPANHVFVMGDNRTGSSDSRVDIVGFIRVDDLLGNVIFRIKPFFTTKPFQFTYKVS